MRGQGQGRGAGGAYQATDGDFTYHRFTQIQLVAPRQSVEVIGEVICRAAWTGRKGDGVVFATPAVSFMRIRIAGAPTDEAPR